LIYKGNTCSKYTHKNEKYNKYNDGFLSHNTCSLIIKGEFTIKITHTQNETFTALFRVSIFISNFAGL